MLESNSDQRKEDVNNFVLLFQRFFFIRDFRKKKESKLKYLRNLNSVHAYLYTEIGPELLIFSHLQVLQNSSMIYAQQ